MEGSSFNSMEGTSMSSQGTTLIDHHPEAEAEAEEESGWTTYLEDFSKYRSPSVYSERHSGLSLSLSIGTSLVSDAASRFHDQANNTLLRGSPHIPAGPKNLSLIKKMRAKKVTEEDPLEDTASSPVSSPKVDDYKRMDMIPRKAEECFGPNFFVNGGSYSYDQSGLDVEATDQRGLRGQNSNSCTSLRNRGMCLVPMSLFADYLG